MELAATNTTNYLLEWLKYHLYVISPIFSLLKKLLLCNVIIIIVARNYKNILWCTLFQLGGWILKRMTEF